MALNQVQEAFVDFKSMHRIFVELTGQVPASDRYKEGLAWSYQFLGNDYKRRGDFEKALEFYTNMHQLFQELIASVPDNLDYKKGLDHSFFRIKEIHDLAGQQEKATEFINLRAVSKKNMLEASAKGQQLENNRQETNLILL